MRQRVPTRDMPALTFRLRKRPDGSAQLVLVREDGSHTSGPLGPAGGYMAVHDLTHYVVERTLGLSEGFLGLVASGWDIADFEVKGAVRLLPDEAMLAEVAAGELSRQEMMGQPSSAEEFIWAVSSYMSRGRPDYRPPITEEALAAMRAELAELHYRWHEVEPGGELTLEFRAERRSQAPRPPRP